MKVTIIEFDKPNHNGRIYLRHEINELPKTVACSLNHKNDAFVMPGLTDENTVGLASITMDEAGIYADVNPYVSKREIFDELMMDGFKIVSAGFGGLNEKSEVTDFRLQYVFLTNE